MLIAASAPLPQNSFHVATAMQNRDDLQRFGCGSIDNEIGENWEKLHVLMRKISSPVTCTWIIRKKREPAFDGSLYAICYALIGLSFDVRPYLTRSCAASGASM
jgi:hypothetical protein